MATETAGCVFLMAGAICLFLGLIVGLRSIFIIRESQGRVRGYGHAILAVVFSLLPFPLLMFFTLTMGVTPARSKGHYTRPVGETEPRRASKASRAFDELVKEPPPPAWFQAPPLTRRLPGPAAVGEDSLKSEDAALLGDLMNRADFEHLDASQVVRWAVHNLREKGTDVPIQVWFALVNVDPDTSEGSIWGTDYFHMKSGRILVGVRTLQPQSGKDLVRRLGEHYTKRMEGVSAR